MYIGANKVVNYSNRNIWCSYSGPSGWKVRLLKAYSSTEWEVDVDYVMAQTSGVLINGRAGWWKLGQGGSFFIANHAQRSKGLVLGASAGGLMDSIRHFDDWAKGMQRQFWESSRVLSDAEIAWFYDWWKSLMNTTAPIDA